MIFFIFFTVVIGWNLRYKVDKHSSFSTEVITKLKFTDGITVLLEYTLGPYEESDSDVDVQDRVETVWPKF